MIEVENLVKNYGSARAIRGVDFKVRKGEILGLLGPNAAGKTTLMRIMTGYLPATSGTVRTCGYDARDKPLEVKRRTGYLPENPPLYNDMTVRAYLTFAAEIKSVPRAKRRARVDEVIDMVDLGSVRDRLIENVSKGFRQRVGLAQALVHDPEVLVLDEPTVGLDPRQIIEIRKLIKEQAGRRTVVLSSHILPEVSATCDRVVILNEGNVVAIDTQEELARRARGGERISLEIAGGAPDEILSATRSIDGVAAAEIVGSEADATLIEVSGSDGSDVRGALFRKVVEMGWTLLGMSRASVSLEEVFLKLTTDEEVGTDDKNILSL